MRRNSSAIATRRATAGRDAAPLECRRTYGRVNCACVPPATRRLRTLPRIPRSAAHACPDDAAVAHFTAFSFNLAHSGGYPPRTARSQEIRLAQRDVERASMLLPDLVRASTEAESREAIASAGPLVKSLAALANDYATKLRTADAAAESRGINGRGSGSAFVAPFVDTAGRGLFGAFPVLRPPPLP
jgi:hypothetical protein